METQLQKSLFYLSLLTPVALKIADGSSNLVFLFLLLIVLLFKLGKTQESKWKLILSPVLLFSLLGLFLFTLLDGIGLTIQQAGLNLIILASFILLFSIRISFTTFGQISLASATSFQVLVLSFVFPYNLALILYIPLYCILFFYFVLVFHLAYKFKAFHQKTENLSRRFQLEKSRNETSRLFLFSCVASLIVFISGTISFLLLPRPSHEKSETTSQIIEDVEKDRRPSIGRGNGPSKPNWPKRDPNKPIIEFPDEIEFEGKYNADAINGIALILQLKNKKGKTYQLKHSLYLRGNIFETYEQEKWVISRRSPQIFIDRDDTVLDQKIELPAAKKTWASPRISIYQDIWLNPHASKACFAIATPYRMTELSSVSYSQGVPAFLSKLTQRINYGAYSYYCPVNVKKLPPKVERSDARLLQLPKKLPVAVEEMAKHITIGSSTDEEKIHALLSYLKNEFRYQLKPKPPPSNVPMIEHFLKTSQTGNCTHFATAFALMLRSLNIPCRVVGGYSGGRWNEFGENYEFQYKHAHAWVEIPFENEGFLPFDSTPASQSSSLLSTEEDLEFQQETPATDLKKTISTWTIFYDSKSQQKIFNFIAYPFMYVASRDTIFLETILIWVALISFLGWLLCQLEQWPRWSFLTKHPFMFQVKRNFSETFRGGKQHQTQLNYNLIPQVYYECLRVLAFYGYPRRSSQTPEEYLSSLPNSIQPLLQRPTSVFQKAFYGKKEIQPQEFEDCVQKLKLLKSSFAKKKSHA